VTPPGRRAARRAEASAAAGSRRAEQQEDQIEAVGDRQGRFRPQPARHQQPKGREGERAQQQYGQRGGGLAAGAPAEERRRHQHQQGNLPALDDQHRQHLGNQQPAAGERRAAQSLEHAVLALEGGRDAEADHPV
jgi:hypothetical protein